MKYIETSFGCIVKLKARLNHKCCLCNRTIKPNQEYYMVKEAWKWDNRKIYGYENYPICQTCWKGKPLESGNKRVFKSTKEFSNSDLRGCSREQAKLNLQELLKERGLS